MTVDPHDSSHHRSDDAPQTAEHFTPSAIPLGTIVDEFGKAYPHAEGSESLKKKPNRFWKMLTRAKGLNVGLTAVIAFATIVQTWNTITNNSSSTEQAKQLIKAAQMSAHSAAHNAAAAQSFAGSAESINKGVADAVGKLNMQAGATNRLVEQSARQAQISNDSLALAFEEQRAWIGVQDFDLLSYNAGIPVKSTFCFVNSGHTPAFNVKYAMKGGGTFLTSHPENERVDQINHADDTGWKYRSIGTIPPQGREKIVAEEPDPLRADFFDATQKGITDSFFSGRLEFDDVLGHHQWVTFCFYIEYLHGAFVWNYCPTQNDMSYQRPQNSKP